MKNILNISDINDEYKNLYYEELLKCFSKDQIYSYGYDPEEHPGEFLIQQINNKYDLIVGHGFGGLLALIIGRATGAKTILINPMYPASRYWSDIYPDYKYKSFIESITEKQICWDTHGETTENIFLILGKDDDLIDTATTDKYLTQGNCFYVEGGHWPSGEDFIMKFGELTGGLIPIGNDLFVEKDVKEQQSLDDFKMLLQAKEKCKLIYLYTYNEENRNVLTKTSKSYLRSLEESDGLNCLYITADSLPVGETDVRAKFRNVDFLVIDKIVPIVLNEDNRRTLWIACDEVTGHGGKVLLLSDSQAADLFEEDKELMDLIYTGYITDLYFDDESGSLNSMGRSSRDTRPFEDYYRVVIIDDIKTKYGNLAIKWHSPDLEARWLYLYFKDGQWFYDSSNGWCSASQAKTVLSAAADKFIENAKETDHDAHRFFGWGW
jgi:hypothetical protein